MEHDIKVPRDLVYTGMEDLDDEGLNRRIVKYLSPFRVWLH